MSYEGFGTEWLQVGIKDLTEAAAESDAAIGHYGQRLEKLKEERALIQQKLDGLNLALKTLAA